jgi:hypothetical protein
MTTERQVRVSYQSTRALTIALAIIAFAIGMVAGAIAVRALDLQADAVVRPAAIVPYKGVADNNMSDAARAGEYAAPWFRGVADHSMTDAALAAGLKAQWFRGVTDNNMSDATRVTRLPGSFRGVAEDNMSDAANRANWGHDR